MGMFDTIQIDPTVARALNIQCQICNRPANELQTKDFDNVMETYYMTYDKNNNVGLLKLDKPHDKRYWREYTDEEIEESKRKYADKKAFSFLFRIEKGEGQWLDEAWKPENRNKKAIPGWPHQYVNAYTSCNSCRDDTDHHKNWIEYNFKFTDGVLQGVTWVGPTY